MKVEFIDRDGDEYSADAGAGGALMRLSINDESFVTFYIEDASKVVNLIQRAAGITA